MTESLFDFNPEDYGAQQASDGWLWPVGDGNVTLHWVLTLAGLIGKAYGTFSNGLGVGYRSTR